MGPDTSKFTNFLQLGDLAPLAGAKSPNWRFSCPKNRQKKVWLKSLKIAQFVEKSNKNFLSAICLLPVEPEVTILRPKCLFCYRLQCLFLKILQILAPSMGSPSKITFFYYIDACRNGFSRNIVTTSLIMTLLIWYIPKCGNPSHAVVLER